jgi:hypothetical protein
MLSVAQFSHASDKDGSEYYQARFSEFENKEIRVKIESVIFSKKDEKDDNLSWFSLFTVDGLIYGVVSNEILRSFERKYKNEDYKNRPRVLTGILKRDGNGTMYIEVK